MLFQVTVLLPPWDVKPVMAGRLNLIDRSSINMTPVTVAAPPDAKLTRSCVVPTGTANRCDICWNGDVEMFPVQPGLLVDVPVVKSCDHNVLLPLSRKANERRILPLVTLYNWYHWT